MNTKSISFLIFILSVVLPACLVGQEKIQWMTFQEALLKSPGSKKKLMIDVHIAKCGWCKVMDQKTFTNPEVIQYVNEHYLAVKFNAEQSEDITYKGKTYTQVRDGRSTYHELAAELMRGRLSYPTIVFLDEHLNLIQPIPGYQDADQFVMVLRYFADNYHQRIPWDRYVQQLKEQPMSQPVNQNKKR